MTSFALSGGGHDTNNNGKADHGNFDIDGQLTGNNLAGLAGNLVEVGVHESTPDGTDNNRGFEVRGSGTLNADGSFTITNLKGVLQGTAERDYDFGLHYDATGDGTAATEISRNWPTHVSTSTITIEADPTLPNVTSVTLSVASVDDADSDGKADHGNFDIVGQLIGENLSGLDGRLVEIVESTYLGYNQSVSRSNFLYEVRGSGTLGADGSFTITNLTGVDQTSVESTRQFYVQYDAAGDGIWASTTIRSRGFADSLTDLADDRGTPPNTPPTVSDFTETGDGEHDRDVYAVGLHGRVHGCGCW